MQPPTCSGPGSGVAAPVPDSATMLAPPAASLWTVSVPGAGPAVVGANANASVQPVPGRSENGGGGQLPSRDR